MARIDIYSILIKEGYKLPYQWSNVMEARKDINHFFKSRPDLNNDKDLLEKRVLYNDSQWNNLVWRLHENGHVKNKLE